MSWYWISNGEGLEMGLEDPSRFNGFKCCQSLIRYCKYFITRAHSWLHRWFLSLDSIFEKYIMYVCVFFIKCK